jgi:hypothetical protein
MTAVETTPATSELLQNVWNQLHPTVVLTLVEPLNCIGSTMSLGDGRDSHALDNENDPDDDLIVSKLK